MTAQQLPDEVWLTDLVVNESADLDAFHRAMLAILRQSLPGLGGHIGHDIEMHHHCPLNQSAD
ncbi:MAG: hypothetical protein ACLP9Y_22605 [Mycobacterium sp.]